MQTPLKLRTQSEDDLALMSGLLQDALISGPDMTFRATEMQFVAIFNRFCWELDLATETTHEGITPQNAFWRTHSALVIERVSGVQSKGVDLGDGGKMLNLLSIHRANGKIELLFSGDAALRVDCPSIEVRLKDIHEPWPTQWRPRHGKDEVIRAEALAQSKKKGPNP